MIPYVSAENVTIDNSMSIQDTVNNANDSDTIFLTPGTYVESGIKIDKNITLQGMGTADEVIIDGNYSNSIILVNSVSQVKFFNLTFINGKSNDYGGAIHSELGGQIYVDSCNFINISATVNGGAIDIAGEQHRIKWEVFTNYGFLNATYCNFINNIAGHDGGALATYWGNSYVYNSVFRQNYADRDGGSVRVGIYSTTLTDNCTFDNNTAVKKGGVVYIAEETPHIPSTVIFENNIIEGNYAKVGSLVYADETTATNTNFNGNSWDIDPTSDEWADAFITNDLIDMPTKFIDSNGNVITVTPKQKATEETIPHVPEEKPNHHEIPEITNQTDTEETNTTIPEITNQTDTIPENTEKTNTTNNNDQNDVIEEI